MRTRCAKVVREIHVLAERRIPRAARRDNRQRLSAFRRYRAAAIAPHGSEKFYDPGPEARKEGLDSLWDSREGLKTLDSPDKRLANAILLDAASDSPDRFKSLDQKGVLTGMATTFMYGISKQTRTSKVEVLHVEYPFHRLSAFPARTPADIRYRLFI